MPLLWNCTDAGSTAYWSSGPGFWMVPDEFERGTLNCCTSPLLTPQCPAVVNIRFRSLKSHELHPSGRCRAERGSVEGSRLSAVPQMVSVALWAPVVTESIASR